MVSTSKGGRSYHHGDLRDALLTEALAVLEADGETGLSLRAVARRAGVSAMAPYRHFADKAALLDAIAARGFRDLGARLSEADAGRPAAAALAAQGAAYVAFACARPALFRLMFATVRPKPGTELGETAERAFRVLSDRAHALPARMAPADLTMAAWSLVHGLAVLTIDGRLKLATEPGAAVAERLTRQFADLALAER